MVSRMPKDKREKRQTTFFQHKHCMVCGKAIPPTDDFCSSECLQKYRSMERRRNLIFWGFIGLLIFWWLLIVILGKAAR